VSDTSRLDAQQTDRALFAPIRFQQKPAASSRQIQQPADGRCPRLPRARRTAHVARAMTALPLLARPSRAPGRLAWILLLLVRPSPMGRCALAPGPAAVGLGARLDSSPTNH